MLLLASGCTLKCEAPMRFRASFSKDQKPAVPEPTPWSLAPSTFAEFDLPIGAILTLLVRAQPKEMQKRKTPGRWGVFRCCIQYARTNNQHINWTDRKRQGNRAD